MKFSFTKEQVEAAKEKGKALFGFEYRGAGKIGMGGPMDSDLAAKCALFLTLIRKRPAHKAFAQAFPESVPKWVPAAEVNEQGEWWWWNGDDDSAPVPVSILYSGFGNSYFASMGQLGWTRAQEVLDMGGWWMRILEPDQPDV